MIKTKLRGMWSGSKRIIIGICLIIGGIYSGHAFLIEAGVPLIQSAVIQHGPVQDGIVASNLPPDQVPADRTEETANHD